MSRAGTNQVGVRDASTNFNTWLLAWFGPEECDSVAAGVIFE
ncbi:uncharacterized protein METZ01_LOCUS378668 [marine metagenome]|jgi:hypothetical protein|uniref:Uncharacterized protein n=1 Tax=marine metagenome TaxID=408172 RepID=A0A382TUT0_9ZZZZ